MYFISSILIIISTFSFAQIDGDLRMPTGPIVQFADPEIIFNQPQYDQIVDKGFICNRPQFTNYLNVSYITIRNTYSVVCTNNELDQKIKINFIYNKRLKLKKVKTRILLN